MCLLFTFGYSSSASPMMPFDSNLVPSSSSPSYTESNVVENLSVRSTATDYSSTAIRLVRGLQGPVLHTWFPLSLISWLPPVVILSLVSKDSFKNLDYWTYTLDRFSGRLLDVVSSTTFSSGDVQADLLHAVTKLMVFLHMYLKL